MLDTNTESSSKILYLDLSDTVKELSNGRVLPVETSVTSPDGNRLCGQLFKELSHRATLRAEDLFASHTKTAFTSGEHKITFSQTVAGRQVFILLNFPLPDETAMPAAMFQMASALLTNNYVMQAVQAAYAARHAGAEKVHLLMPNFAYARQDKPHKERAPISAAITTRLLEDYFDTVTSLHLHSPAIEGMARPGNLTNIAPTEIFAASLVCRDPETMEAIAPSEVTKAGIQKLFNRICLVSPDFGGSDNVRNMAKYCKKFAATLLHIDQGGLPDIPLALIDKRRPGPNVSEVMHVLGRENVEGRNAILIDDMIDTAGSIVKAAAALKDAGATDVEALATHGYWLGSALQKLTDSPICRVTVTDSMEPRPAVLANSKIRILSIAPILAQVIADRTTKPEPNLRFNARHVGDEALRNNLGRYAATMLTEARL